MRTGSAFVALSVLAVSSAVVVRAARADTVIKLGQLNPRAPFTYYGDNSSTGKLYQGIWGYSNGTQEYALICHSDGLTIIDVTNPTSPFQAQFIAMPGGRIHRDVHVFNDINSGKSYAYVGGQESSDVWVVDLSYLPGTIPSSGYKSLGYLNYAHTLFMLPTRSLGDPADGVLFMNSAGTTLGCKLLDVLADPWTPPLLPWSWTGGDCHDSFARNATFYTADGYMRKWSINDLSAAHTSTYDSARDFLGQTAPVTGIYAHSCWLTDDSQYMYSFEEFNLKDIIVYNVSNPTTPAFVKYVQWSGDASANSIIHNGQVLGNRLHTAYYEAGYRIFDTTDPANPVESGNYETWRDPDGDGTFNASITGNYNGAWNVYVFAPSGNIYVSDMKSGLFIFDVILGTPNPPSGLSATPGNTQVSLAWTGSSGATSYNVKRSPTSAGPYGDIAIGLTATAYTDTGLANGTTYYYVVTAVNASGESNFSNRVSATPAASVVVASDGFESGNYSGGTGWLGSWTATGDVSILTTSGPHSGTRHVRLRQSTGDLKRSVNLSGRTGVHLKFWAKVSSFEGNDRADVKVSADGTNFTIVKTFLPADSDNIYKQYDIDLSGFTLSSNFRIRFDAGMNSTSDQWYIDDVEVRANP